MQSLSCQICCDARCNLQWHFTSLGHKHSFPQVVFILYISFQDTKRIDMKKLVDGRIE